MNTGNMEETLHAYLDAGMALVFFPNNVKGPIGSAAMGWNRPENCITRDKADKLRDLASRPTNVGLAHAYSGTCSIDIDNLFAAREWLAQHNVDLDALFNADDSVTIDSGRGNHGKLLYRLPKVMPQKKISSTSGGDIIDFRCAAANGNTVQDCLPPSYNPDAKAHYQWGGNGDYRSLPLIPPELLAVWQSLVDAQAHANAEPFVGNINSLDHLSLSHKTLTTIQTGVHPDAKAAGKEKDRSWNLIKVLNAMVSAGASEQLIAETVSNPQYPISNKPLEKGASWLKAEIQRAQLYIGAQKQQIGELNVVDKRTGEITTVDFIVADTSANDGDAIGAALNLPHTYKRKFRLIRAGDIKPRPVEFQIADYVEMGSVHCVFGDPEALKTFAVLGMGLAIAAGRPWHGRDVQKGTVVYICGEGERGIGRRIEGWCKANGIERSSLDFYVSTVATNFQDPRIRQDLIEALHADLDGLQPALIIIDTIARNIGGSEDKNDDINLMFDLIDQEIRAENPCTVILVGHPGHGDKNRPRGGSALLGNLDSSARMVAGDDLTTTYTPMKMKDAPRPEPVSFQGVEVSIQLGNEVGTTLVLEPTETEAEGDQRKRASDGQQAAMKAFVAAGNGKPVHLDVWREAYYRASTADNQNAKRQAFTRARKQLVEIGVLGVADDVYHTTGHWPVKGLAGEIIVRMRKKD